MMKMELCKVKVAFELIVLACVQSCVAVLVQNLTVAYFQLAILHIALANFELGKIVSTQK